MTTLKQKTINGVFWSVGERISEQLALMVTSIILARLLEPADFGLIGMLSIFIAIAQSIIDSGFGSALIQKKDADQTDASSIFFFNLSLGLLFAAILFFIAPLIANFYQQSILIPITRVISLNLIISSFSLVQISFLTKEMKFKTQMMAGLISVIVSGIIGIIFAYFEFGVWSLVYQGLTRYLVRTILLWFMSDWRPSLIFSINSLASMFSYGSRLLFSGILDTAFNNIYQTFIGRFFTPADLGYYSKAQTLQIAATRATSTSLSRVTFAAWTPHQNNDNILKKSYKRAIKLSSYIHFPLMIGLIAIANPLIILLLSEKWAPAIEYFQLLCIVGLLIPVNYFNQNILKIKGRTDLFFRRNIISKVLTVIIIIFTFRMGINALIIGQIISTFFTYLINSHYAKKLIGYSQIEQIKDFSPFLVKSIIMGILIYIISFIMPENILIDLIIRILSGIGIYIFLSIIFKTEEFYEVFEIIKIYIQSIILIFKKVLNNNHD